MSEDQATSSPTAGTGEESSATENVESTLESKETQAQEQPPGSFAPRSMEVIENTIKDAYFETSKMMIIEESLMIESVMGHKIHRSYYDSWKENTNDYFRLLNRFERRFRRYKELSAQKSSDAEAANTENSTETAEVEKVESAAS